MPDHGRGAARDLVTLPSDDWEAAGARILQVTYEVDQEAALDLLPAEATRPVPCYGRIIVVESGNARFGGLFVGGRYNLLPRNVLVDAMHAGAGGLVGAEGEVAPWSEDSRAGAVLNPGGLKVEVTLPALRAVDPSMLRWDPWVARDEGGAIGEWAFEPRLERAWLSKGATVSITGEEQGEPWARLHNLKTISACMAEGDVRLARMKAPVATG